MTNILSTFDFDTGNIAEVRQMIIALGGTRLPVFPETYAVEGFNDNGVPTITFYRKATPTGFFATEMAKAA